MLVRFFLELLIVVVLASAARGEPPVAELLKLHTSEAEAYRMYRDAGHKEPAELNPKPVFNWTNFVGEHTQYGHLFVWLHQGRPEVIGTMFSTRTSDPTQRKVVHEFHTLSDRQLFPVTPTGSMYQWKPERGIEIAPLEGAPAVAATSGQRLPQMRSLARSYSASSRSREGKTWELKLLPTPLFTYEPTGGDVLAGGLFALISSAGTDPEVLLLIEARHSERDNKTWAWYGAALRFSDKDLTVKRNGKLLWSSESDASKHGDINASYTLIQTPDKTYTCYHSRTIAELPDAAP